MLRLGHELQTNTHFGYTYVRKEGVCIKVGDDVQNISENKTTHYQKKKEIDKNNFISIVFIYTPTRYIKKVNKCRPYLD